MSEWKCFHAIDLLPLLMSFHHLFLDVSCFCGAIKQFQWIYKHYFWQLWDGFLWYIGWCSDVFFQQFGICLYKVYMLGWRLMSERDLRISNDRKIFVCFKNLKWRYYKCKHISASGPWIYINIQAAFCIEIAISCTIMLFCWRAMSNTELFVFAYNK